MDESELLFAEILNCDRLSLHLNKNLILDKDQSCAVSNVLKRRINGEPIQYILGKTEFMGLEFIVTPDVLIPRPETEILVETVLKQSSVYRRPSSTINVLEIGTGSGCIAASLAKFLTDVEITATDISESALKIASSNAQLHNVAHKIRFIKSDLFTEYGIRNTEYDIIVSNPPYIATADIDNLQPEIKHEPRIALDGGRDGLDFYRKIIAISSKYLKKCGLLILEIGFNQKEGIRNIFQNSPKFEIIEVVKDYSGIERVIVAKNLKQAG